VVGLGRAGLAAARALAAAADPEATRVWDLEADPPQQQRARALRQIGVDVRLGGDGLDALGDVRTVVKSPGVPPEIPVLAAAARRGIEIVDELDIGWRLVSAPTVAVTGTNGKTTVSALCVEVLAEHGFEPALAGNTLLGPPLSELSLAPPPRSVVAEVSSYQAEYSRALAVDAAIFTNLTPDHLNRHGTMEAYGAAKRRLFIRDDWTVPLAAVNVDDRLGRELADEIEIRGSRALRYGWDTNAAYRIVECSSGLTEGEVRVEAPDGPVDFVTRLPGGHNAANATAVLALADGLGLPRAGTLAALASTAPVPGRFEVIAVDRPFDIVVDLAYTVDSIAKFLAAARARVSQHGGRILTVLAIVGRAGPETGGAAAALARELSDHLILSGTSYRGESRLVSLQAMAVGARAAGGCELEIVIDREAAISRAIAAARPGDFVAILGRGSIRYEATDTRGGSRPLDDRQVAREIVERCAS
jgi:UDP-N-acetylmuramoylalanine-D-glutamate ligase